MKPNFALNLSHEGISLLHRAKTGWLRIGDVALNDPDLQDQLNMLRSTAAGLESGGLTCKLVIPNSQILYTEIETPGPDTAARIGQIRDGLAGLTPYDVADLVFDWRLAGTRAQVAVVARETLQEAEAFAAEFRFNPVSFVASPVNGGFDGEPFFGPTKHAAALLADGETIEPDEDRMAVLGPDPARGPRPETAATEVPDAPEVTGPVAPASKAAPAPDTAPPPAATAPEREPPLQLRQRISDKPAARTRSRKKTKNRAQPVPPVAPETAEPPPVTFASRRGPDAETAPSPPLDPVPAAGAVAPGPEPSLRFSHHSALDIDDVPDLPAHGAQGGAVTPMPVTAAHTADPLPPPVRGADRPKAAHVPAKAAGTAIAGTFGRIGRGTAEGMRRMRDRKGNAEAATVEADALTVFGARGKPPTRGRSRYLGLTLTLLLIAALAVLALWSTLFVDGRSGMSADPTAEPAEIAQTAPDRPAPAAEPAGTPAAATGPDAADRNTAPDPGAAEPEDTASTGAGPVDPIEAAVISALSDPASAGAAPDQSAAPAATEPEALADGAPDLAGIEPEALADGEPDLAGIEPEALADGEPDLASLQDPATALTDAPAPDQVLRPPPTRAEAEASYAATGIWQLDPDPLPGDTGGDRLEDLYVASIDPLVSAQDAIALPPAGALLNDLRPPTQSPPLALGLALDLDERGLVRATPEGALSPEGVLIIDGTPPVVPGIRPGTVTSTAEAPGIETATEPGNDAGGGPETGAVTDPLPDAERERLRGIRPRARPDTLQETNERFRLGGRSLTELARIRPTPRPPSAQEAFRQAAAQGTATTGATGAAETPPSGASGTDLAVLASLSPAGRPRDFARVVEKALAEAAEAEAEPEPESAPTPGAAPAPAVAAARVPSIPTRASVAKQATVRNVIHLRQVNLIGVYGSPSDRRALVRLKSGRYVKVEVGDRVDGGRVAAIGNDELRYIKGGRNITLKLPSG